MIGRPFLLKESIQNHLSDSSLGPAFLSGLISYSATAARIATLTHALISQKCSHIERICPPNTLELKPRYPSIERYDGYWLDMGFHPSLIQSQIRDKLMYFFPDKDYIQNLEGVIIRETVRIDI